MIFHALKCSEQFELKSYLGNAPTKINDGAYESIIKRIMDIKSPHFFFLGYNENYFVVNCIAVPNYLLQPDTIEKRKPLALTARRAGWVGCLILLNQIPDFGKIKLVENCKAVKREVVKEAWQKTHFLAEQQNIKNRGWALDILICIEKLNRIFTLNELYAFESQLSLKHPDNKHIKDKIRQQLQVLRDKGLIEFVKPGLYRFREYI